MAARGATIYRYLSNAHTYIQHFKIKSIFNRLKIVHNSIASTFPTTNQHMTWWCIWQILIYSSASSGHSLNYYFHPTARKVLFCHFLFKKFLLAKDFIVASRSLPPQNFEHFDGALDSWYCRNSVDPHGTKSPLEILRPSGLPK